MTARRYVGYLFVLPYLVLFLGFIVLPLLFGLGLSLCRWEMLSPGPPAVVGFANYREALGDDYFWRALGATATFVALDVPFKILLALALALGINAVKRGRSFFRASVVLPTMINISVAGILWRWFYNTEFGLFNACLEPLGLRVPWISHPGLAMPSVVLMTFWWTVGGAVLILMAGLHQIPDSYYEAASIDGAGRWARLRHVTLPLLKPGTIFVIVMNIIGSFQVVGQTFMITRGGPELSTRVLMQYVYETAFLHFRMGYGAAMSWLLFLVIALFSATQFYLLRRS